MTFQELARMDGVAIGEGSPASAIRCTSGMSNADVLSLAVARSSFHSEAALQRGLTDDGLAPRMTTIPSALPASRQAVISEATYRASMYLRLGMPLTPPRGFADHRGSTYPRPASDPLRRWPVTSSRGDTCTGSDWCKQAAIFADSFVCLNERRVTI